MIKLDTIKPNENNPRKIKPKQLEKLIASISSFPKMMELRPIIFDDKGVILGGNMRYRALIELGKTSVPNSWIKRASDLTDEERRRFVVEDNVEFGEWDFEGLSNFSVTELEEWGLDIPRDMFGIALKPEDDNIPEKINPIAKRNDVYALGKHRVMCGDAVSGDDVVRLMDGNSADVVFTDPPYNVDYSSKNELLNLYDKGNSVQTDMVGDNHISTSEYKAFCDGFAAAFIPHLSPYNTLYICGNYESLLHFYKMRKIKISNMLVWMKSSMVIGRMDYQNRHEFILYGWVGKHKWYGDRKQTTVWEYAKPSKSDLHPTMKPVELIANALLNSSETKHAVLDPFLGSGSTLIACEKLDRICYGMEIDPHYVDVIIRRWEEYTGKKARKLKKVKAPAK